MKKYFKIPALLLATALISFSFIHQSVTGLQVGEVAPDFEAKDQKGRSFKLSEALSKGPVVVIFYRGEWCPFCNRYLGNIQDSMFVLKAKGASVIGVSFEDAEGIKKTVYKTAAKFPLISDSENTICRAYKVAEQNSSVPIPATYVIGKDGRIKFVHFDKDYQKRPTVQQLVSQM